MSSVSFVGNGMQIHQNSVGISVENRSYGRRLKSDRKILRIKKAAGVFCCGGGLRFSISEVQTELSFVPPEAQQINEYG